MKKEKKQILKANSSVESDEYKKLIKLILIIAIVFLIFYLATIMFTKKNHDDIFANDLNANEIQYDEVIVGNMFDKSGDYYVLLLEKDDPYKDLFTSYLTNIRKNTKIYTVDLSSAFNKAYLSDEYSYETSNFKTKGTLLLEISDKNIKNHYESKEDILSKLKSLSGE